MRCIYCGAEIKEGCIYCSACGKEAQIVPDYNAFEDDYLNGLIGSDSDSKKPSSEQLKKARAEKKKKEELRAKREQQKKIIIISVVVIILAVIILVFAIISSIKNKQNNSFDYQVEQAEKAEKNADDDKAVEYYERALELDENNIDVRYALADIYMDQDELDSAMILYKEIISIDKTEIDSYKQLIAIYEEKKDYEAVAKLAEGVKDAKILALFDDYIATAPIFSLEGGDYDSEISIELSADSGSTIYYTTDGKDPIESGKVYDSEIKFEDEGSYTIKAVAKSDKGIYSDVITEKYTIEFREPDMPVVNPDGGTFSAETTVLVDVPSGCQAYYTWDSSDPNIDSDLYAGGITVPVGNNILSVVIYNPETEKFSEVYKGRFVYYN